MYPFDPTIGKDYTEDITGFVTWKLLIELFVLRFTTKPGITATSVIPSAIYLILRKRQP